MAKDIGGGYTFESNGVSDSYVDTGFALSALSDVEITDPTDGDILTYDGTEEKWVNSAAENTEPTNEENTEPTDD